MTFDAPLAATTVGSFPHTNPDVACQLILENFPEIPVWPQLPSCGLREQMEIQYSEGLPRVVIDEDKRRMFIDTSGDPTPDLEKFYENVITENLDHFAISTEYSRGLPAMLDHLERADRSAIRYLKMQVTGPVSFGLTTVDQNKRAIYYDEVFRDVIVKGMAAKARWQLRQFYPLNEKRICFVDEPILSAFGSSTYVSVKREDVVSQLKEMVEAIHGEGALAGIHCCGNTEWTIPIDAGFDIINFDAFGYGDSIGLYPEQMKGFLEGGGVLAWGIVPTSQEFHNQTVESLMSRFDKLVDDLASKGLDKALLIQQSLITASCGVGSIPVERAEGVTRMIKQVSDGLKERHGQ